MINSKGLKAHLPEYPYPQFLNADSASVDWSPTYQPYSPYQAMHDVSRIVNAEDASSIAMNGEIDNHVVENHQIANYHSMVNQLIQTPNSVSQMESKIFLDQISPAALPPNSMLSMPRTDLMTVEQTAAWIWMVGHVSGWEEADQYAQSFQKNNIWGYLLQKLTLDYLKSDLGIKKFGHRLKIMSEIRHLLDGMLGWDGQVEVDNDHSRRLRADASVVDTHDSISYPHMRKETRSKFSRNQSIAASNSNPIDVPRVEEENREAQLPHKSAPNKERSSITRAKSTRASPDNPTRYKTFHNVKIRSGKSVRSADIGYLPKGSVVVINQVKGRSGRVVVQRDDGEFVKIGWVTLYTSDRQLLRKCVHKKNRT